MSEDRRAGDLDSLAEDDRDLALIDAHRAFLATSLGVIAFVAAVVSFIL